MLKAANSYSLLAVISALLILSQPVVGKDDGKLGGKTGMETVFSDALNVPGHVVLMRHALAPGTGDPSNFALSDCRTQRNLSKAGRDQAVRIGQRLRALGLQAADVYSSQWCRCLDTARLLGLGEVKELSELNSFFGRPGEREPSLKALRQWLSRTTFETTAVLVTHQVTITGLTDVYPGSGEMVLVKLLNNGDIAVIARLETSAY